MFTGVVGVEFDHAKLEKAVGGFLHVPGLNGPGARQDRIYGSQLSNDPQVKYPKNNQEDKVPEILERRRGKVDHAIWGASITDITNLKKQYIASTKKKNKDKFISDEKARIYNSAAQSSLTSIEVAEKVLKDNPLLKKAIVTERPPRYDEMFDVNEFSNFVLRARALKSEYRGRLVVGEHTLHGSGARREARYGRPGFTRGYDGVHFRTEEGRKAFTASMTRILRNEGVGTVEDQAGSEWQVVRGRGSARRMEAEDNSEGVSTANRYSSLN